MNKKVREFINFSMPSFVSTVVDLVLFAVSVFFLKDQAPQYYILIATIGARLVSTLVNYNLNAKLVFSGADDRKLQFL